MRAHRARAWVRPLMRAYWTATNPLIRPLAGLAPWWVLLETTGRRSGKVRRVPLAAGPRYGESMLLIAVHGRRAGWVRNIEHYENVRLRHKGRWSPATATIAPFDPSMLERLSAYARLGPRSIGIDPVFVRVTFRSDEPAAS